MSWDSYSQGTQDLTCAAYRASPDEFLKGFSAEFDSGLVRSFYDGACT